VTGVPLDIPPDKVLREVAQQPEKGYNTLDVSSVTLVKATDALP
jgi:hypothetical protein